MPGEEQEFRIYASECGGEPVVKDICGLEALKQRLAEVKNNWPNSTIVIREVLETVYEVILSPQSPPLPPSPAATDQQDGADLAQQ